MSDVFFGDDDQTRHQLASLRAQARAAARKNRIAEDPNSFIEHILQDENGKFLRQAPFHREWQDTLTANDRVCLFAPMEHGKTVQVSVGRALWEVGRRMVAGQSPRIALFGWTQRQASKPLTAIKSHIEHSDRLHRIYPGLRREAFSEWTGSHIKLRPTRATTLKDPTIQAVGAGGTVLGSRLDVAIVDNLLVLDNTWTHERREKMIAWFESNIPGRMVDGGVIWFIDTAWHPKDLAHFLELNEEYVTRRYPITSKPRGKGKRLWPQQWSRERIAKRMRELTPYRYSQQYECKAVDSETSRFVTEWFDRCAEQGRGLAWPQHTPMEIVITGVDLGVGRKRTSGETSLFTVGVDLVTKRRRPLAVDHGRWRKRDIIERIQGVFRKYGSIVMVENNAAQDYIVQELEDETDVTVVAYTTSKRKRDPIFGIESLGVDLQNRRWELASDQNGKLPVVLELWKDQCMEWKPTEHPGDILMASFLALEGIRRFEWLEGEGTVGIGGDDDEGETNEDDSVFHM